MITYYKSTLKQPRLKKLNKFQVGSWINVINPPHKEINEIASTFGLDKRNLNSGMDQNELPRIDFVGDNTYIFVKIITPKEKMEFNTVLIVIADNFILTLSKEPADYMQDIFKKDSEFISTQRVKCAMKLLFIINQGFENNTTSIVKLVNSKKNYLRKLKSKDVNDVLEHEDNLNTLVTTYYYTNLLYDRMIKKIKIFEADREIIEDLVIETHQGYNLCRSSLKTISHIRNSYNIMLSNRLNRVITILTIFTIFISVPAAISGLYGMNLVLPLAKNSMAFYYVLMMVGIVWLIFAWFFKKEDVL